MVYANVFSKIAGVIFYVCIGISVCILAYGGIRRLIEIIRRKRKAKKDAEEDNNDAEN